MSSIYVLAKLTCPIRWLHRTLRVLENSQNVLGYLHPWLYIFVRVSSLALNVPFITLLKSYLSFLLIKGHLHLVTVLIYLYQIECLSLKFNSVPPFSEIPEKCLLLPILLTKFCFNNSYLYGYPSHETVNSLRKNVLVIF